MAWAHKASSDASVSAASGTSIQVAAGTSFAIGDFVIAQVSGGVTSGSLTISSVTSTLVTGNFVLLKSEAYSGSGAAAAVSALYVGQITTAGTPTVVANFSASASNGCAISVAGFTGITTNTDGVNAATGTTANGSSGASSPATTGANELAVSGYGDQGGSQTVAVGSGWTAGSLISGTANNNVGIEYKDSGVIGSTINGVWANGSGTAWGITVAVVPLPAVAAGVSTQFYIPIGMGPPMLGVPWNSVKFPPPQVDWPNQILATQQQYQPYPAGPSGTGTPWGVPGRILEQLPPAAVQGVSVPAPQSNPRPPCPPTIPAGLRWWKNAAVGDMH